MVEWIRLVLELLLIPLFVWMVRIESRLAGLEAQLKIIGCIVLDEKSRREPRGVD